MGKEMPLQVLDQKAGGFYRERSSALDPSLDKAPPHFPPTPRPDEGPLRRSSRLASFKHQV